jgi:hypothetical protein
MATNASPKDLLALANALDGSATLPLASAVDVAGALTGLQKVIAGGAAYTVTAADGGAIILTATDNAVISLPAVSSSNKGLCITVQNSGADGAAKVSISPAAADAIFGGVHGAATGDLVSFSGTDNKDAINTKATTKKGDYLTLFSDGDTGWFVVGGKGVWASEA